MKTYGHEPARNADGAPACEDCGSTRLRAGTDGYAECLGCGSRYAITAAAGAQASAWQRATPDARLHGKLEDAPAVPRTPTSAELLARSPKRRSSFIGMIVAGAVGATAWFIFGGGAPSDCQPITAGTAADLAHGITAVDIDVAASLARDGGTYIVAELRNGDELTWFQTPAGTTYSVGAVTELYSNFPDAAAHTMAGVGTDGYDDARACLG